MRLALILNISNTTVSFNYDLKLLLNILLLHTNMLPLYITPIYSFTYICILEGYLPYAEYRNLWTKTLSVEIK